MKHYKKYSKEYWLLFTITLVFICSRLFNLSNTLHIFGDTARDLLVLEDWFQTIKPPLLGPHTSALSFNQSAWYFYLLMPFYIFSGQHIFSPNLAIISLYLGLFLFLIKLWRDKQFNFSSLVALFLLITLHPQVLQQTRDIWNPSIILPIFVVGTYAWLKLLKTYSKRLIWIFALAVMFCVGANYSIIPTIIVMCAILTWYLLKQKPFVGRLKRVSTLLIALFVSTIVVNIGTIGYELRYNFQLTRNLPNQQVLQVSQNIPDKFSKIIQYSWGTSSTTMGIILSLGLIILAIYGYKHLNKERRIFLASTSILLLSSIALTLVLPFQVYEHYVFGFIGLILVIIALLPNKSKVVMATALIGVYFWQLGKTNVFAPASPTLSQKQSCIEQVCTQYSGYLYVVGNTSSHDHQALGYEYLGQRRGCKTVSILKYPKYMPKTMVVFSENTLFDQESTDFYELNQFGPREHLEQIDCGNNITADIFTKLVE
jgi:hypothetical protein